MSKPKVFDTQTDDDEEDLELSDEVKAKLDESQRQIAAGNYTVRNSEREPKARKLH